MFQKLHPLCGTKLATVLVARVALPSFQHCWYARANPVDHSICHYRVSTHRTFPAEPVSSLYPSSIFSPIHISLTSTHHPCPCPCPRTPLKLASPSLPTSTPLLLAQPASWETPVTSSSKASFTQRRPSTLTAPRVRAASQTSTPTPRTAIFVPSSTTTQLSSMRRTKRHGTRFATPSTATSTEPRS